MNTIVYIDGGNLYHGLLRFHPELKWIDLEKFAKALVRSDHEICAVKYFTSRIKTHPYVLFGRSHASACSHSFNSLNSLNSRSETTDCTDCG